jgi:hypothetical protein
LRRWEKERRTNAVQPRQYVALNNLSNTFPTTFLTYPRKRRDEGLLFLDFFSRHITHFPSGAFLKQV